MITGVHGILSTGSFGTTAGTFCEGNDSRLSDARTPVAHTHTKSDVTDLLNSNFIPSANNSYDLGSSSYQWNNLYAKNYYYNGVAWGLDKANTWGQVQTISYSGVPTIRYIHPSLDIGSAPASDCGMQLNFCDAGTNVVSAFQYIKGSGVSRLSILLSTKNSNNQIIEKTLRLQTNQEGTNWDFYPSSNREINLGTSANKWKTLNGINPGALSLPSASYIDISSSITDRNYGANYYTAPSDGYVCVGCMASSLQISNDTLGFGISAGTAQDGYSSVYIPVRTGDTVRIQVNQTSTDYQYFSFYPCAGNV